MSAPNPPTIHSAAPLASIALVTPADRDRCERTLVSAFLDDPVLAWVFPDQHRRTLQLSGFFGAILDHVVPHGSVESLGDDAVAVWVGPGVEIDDEALAEDLIAAAGPDADRLVQLLESLDEHHPPSPHDYLFLVGVATRQQNAGLGGTLIGSRLARCDEVAVPAYLEATTDRSRRLYERLGFEVTRVVDLPTGPPVWCMWRDPVRRAG